MDLNNTGGKHAHTWNMFTILLNCFEDEQTAEAKTVPKIALSKEELKEGGVKVPTKLYNRSNLELLAKLIMAENGSAKHDETLYLTGAVVLKRVKAKSYPNTIQGVIYQKGQYSTASRLSSVKPSERCYEIANDLLVNGVDDLPNNLVFQSMFKQGKKIYKIVDGEYFCLA
jgi:spore germination cell wall hydrolase CwlJ-like protein